MNDEKKFIIRFTFTIDYNVCDIDSREYTLEELIGICKFIYNLPMCIHIKGYINHIPIIDNFKSKASTLQMIASLQDSE